VAVAGLEEAEAVVDVVVEVGQAEAVVGPEEAEAVVDMVVEVGQVEVAAARRVAEVAAARRVAEEEALADPAIAVAREVLIRIIPAALLSVTTRWLPYRILFARRTVYGP
jgi:hypothetical protein